MQLRTFKLKDGKEPIYHEFKKICLRENIELSDKLTELIEKYIKEHGDGNPVYPLDKWQDPNFKAIPALASDFNTWFNFIRKCNNKEREEIKQFVITLDNALTKAWRLPVG